MTYYEDHREERMAYQLAYQKEKRKKDPESCRAYDRYFYENFRRKEPLYRELNKARSKAFYELNNKARSKAHYDKVVRGQKPKKEIREIVFGNGDSIFIFNVPH